MSAQVPPVNFLNELTGLLTLWVGAFLVISGDLTIGQLLHSG